MELIIALAILSIGLVGAVRVFPVGLRASQRAGQASRATLAAQRTMESLKLKDWEEIISTETPVREDPFEITVQVDEPDIEGLVDPSRLKRVTVTVQWIQDGRTRTVSVVTYVHRPPA